MEIKNSMYLFINISLLVMCFFMSVEIVKNICCILCGKNLDGTDIEEKE